MRALERAEEFIREHPHANRIPAPDFILRALEDVGSVEDSVLREMWAGLLASACVTDEAEHPVFLDTLRQMGPNEARTFHRVCSMFRVPLPGKEPPAEKQLFTERRSLTVLEHLGLIDMAACLRVDPQQGIENYGLMLARAINALAPKEE